MSNRPYLSYIDQNIERPNLKNVQKAIFVVHDQLNLDQWPDWVKEEQPLLIFIESKAKGSSLPYHKKKLVYVLSSMRHFAIECAEAGYPVLYHSTETWYEEAVSDLLQEYPELSLMMMSASEWDTREQQHNVRKKFENRVEIIPNTFFLADVDDYKDKIAPGYRMEYFYRDMRRTTGYLMDGKDPEGGEWNYDEENRKKLPRKITIPQRASTEKDEITAEVIELVSNEYSDHFGEIEGFDIAVSRRQALYRLKEFIDERLDEFGPYEDAMATGKDVIFHSQLSIYMNNGLLHPKEICDKAQEAYNAGKVRLNSVEGFIRQIIGWREFVRVYYEAMMPDVRETNYFGFERDLPDLYWSGYTKMHCMSECVRPVIQDGYSHHIPRLMVLSNFSNLTQTDPRKLNEWFWFGYLDAYEWVVLPNVLGMSTFADGGVLASKPYVAGGNYINKMSDYCKSCEYSVKEKTGENACPFNYLYWNFIDQERETFLENGRANFMVNMFDKKDSEEKKAIRDSSEKFINNLKRYS